MSKIPPDGFLLVDKPAGPTSHDIVAQVRHLLTTHYSLPTKVGHTGTLDPFATGLLIVTIGAAARLAEYTHGWKKTYRAEVMLGAVSDTDDVTGAITPGKKIVPPQPPEVARVLAAFVGSQQQLPPAFAAIKVGGEKFYELARQGREVPRTPRAITIDAITLQSYAFPHLVLETTVSTGTYIRALARDIGQQLNTGAHLASLQRTAVGPFDITKAIKLSELSGETLPQHLQPAKQLVPHLPRVTLPADNVAQFIAGQAVQGSGSSAAMPAGPIAVFTPRQELLGIARPGPAGSLQPEKVFRPPPPG